MIPNLILIGDDMRKQNSILARWGIYVVVFLPFIDQATAVAGPAGLGTPSAKDHHLAIMVSSLLEQLHVSKRKVDDTVSRRAFDLFLGSLDPRKLYFLKSDIDEFSKLSTRLDDLLKAGDVTPAFRIYKRFLKRIDERMDVFDELIDGEFDFTIDEFADTEPSRFPTTSEEARDRWRREIKLQLLVLEASDDESSPATTKFDSDSSTDSSDSAPTEPKRELDPVSRIRRRFHRIAGRMRRLDSGKLVEMYMNAISNSYDPHTAYMSPSTLERFMTLMSLNLEGIGAELREEDEYTSVIGIIDGGAASRESNLKIGDKIIAVSEGGNGVWEDTVGMAIDEVASRVRGKPGTTVRLKLLPVVGDVKEVRLVRSRIELNDRRASGREVAFETEEQESLRAGYIALPSFYRDIDALQRGETGFRSCSRDVNDLLGQFRKNSVDAVVLDLRGNGGGYLEEAIQLVGLFIDRGPVVQIRKSNGTIARYNDTSPGVAWGGPLVILTDSDSASASEIVAGAIQDYGRGLVVGDQQTHGKGSVQTPLDVAESVFGVRDNLPNYGSLKVTVQRYYLPDGDSTQMDGVKADVALPSVRTYAAVGERELKYALLKDQIPAAKHRSYKLSSADLLNRLRTASKRRVENSPSFSRIKTRMEAARENGLKKQISIKKSQFEATRQLLRGDDTREDKTSDGFPTNDYENEVLEIVQDYVEEWTKRELLTVG